MRRGLASKTLNRKLREDGLMPVTWKGTVARLREGGIEVKLEKSVPVAPLVRPGSREGERAHWAPAWAVLVAEAEPCNETAREWALRHAVENPEFAAELDTLARLGCDRRKMGEYVMERWEP